MTDFLQLAAPGVRQLRPYQPGKPIEELERALAGYDGTVLLVTHDRVFLDRFGATRTIDL